MVGVANGLLPFLDLSEDLHEGLGARRFCELTGDCVGSRAGGASRSTLHVCLGVTVPQAQESLDGCFGDLRGVLPGRHDVALAGDDVPNGEERRKALDVAHVPVGEVKELALHGNAVDGFGDAADRADHPGAATLEGLVGGDDPAVLDLRSAKAQPDESAILDDQAVW